MRSRLISGLASIFAFAAAILLNCGVSDAQHRGPFARFTGVWSGGGMLELSDGKRDRIRCRAAYDVPSAQSVQLNIRCASESYNFEIRGSVAYASGAISGNWSEGSTGAFGELNGRASDGHINATATAASFVASLNLAVQGNQQSVSIRSKSPQSSIRGVSIALRRANS